jgi:hypothetical protein
MKLVQFIKLKAGCINLRFIHNRILCPKTLCLRTALEVPWYSAETGGLKASESLGLFVIFTRGCEFFKVCSGASMSIAMVM